MPRLRVIEGELVEGVYECWVNDIPGSFCKNETPDDVVAWVQEMLRQLPMHGRIHIVLHDASEYSNAEQRNQPNDIYPIT